MKTEKYLSLLRNIHALFKKTMTRQEISDTNDQGNLKKVI